MHDVTNMLVRWQGDYAAFTKIDPVVMVSLAVVVLWMRGYP